MKQNKMTRVFSWTLAKIAVMTMVFSPVAYGKEAENNYIKGIKENIGFVAKNPNLTYGQLWNEIKYDVPGYLYKDFESFIQVNAKSKAPTMDVKVIKNNKGEEVPVLTITESGKTVTIQVLDEGKKFLKINNTIVTEAEASNPTKLFAKLSKEDPTFNKYANQQIKKYNAKLNDLNDRPFQDFNGLPRMTKQLWQAMTPYQRAQYIVEIRLLNEKATLVQYGKEALDKAQGKKTSAFNYLEKYQSVWELLLGDAAVAKPVFAGEHCITQGFVADDNSSYTKTNNYRTKQSTEACNLEKVLQSEKYAKDASVQKAVAYCKSQNALPCNPLVYSFNEKGEAHCSSSYKDAGAQTATHWQGSCDGKSPLSNAFVATNKPVTQENREEVVEKIRQDQEKDSYKLTQNYIQGMLAADGKSDLAEKLQKGIWDPKLEEEFARIQKAFEENITKSMGMCSTELNVGKAVKHEPNFNGACEQLHRRWLFSKELFATLKCENGQEFITDAKSGKKVCAVPAKPPVVVPPAKPACPEFSQLMPGTENCICEGTKTEVPVGSPPEACGVPAKCDPNSKHHENAVKEGLCEKDCPYKDVKGIDLKTCLCENTKKAPTLKMKVQNSNQYPHNDKDEYECREDNKILMWIAIGAAVLVGLCLFKVICKDKKPKPPVVTPPPTVTPPVKPPHKPKPPRKPPVNPPVESCPGGQTRIDGVCRCATACAAIYTQNPLTCGCVPITPPACPGGQTRINGVCQCANTCSSPFSQNSLSCACVAPPSEGGGGESGGSSGGVPPVGTGQ